AHAPTGAEEAICKFAIEQFRAEGMQTFRLGLLPLYDVEGSGFREAWRLKKLFQWIYRYGDRWISASAVLPISNTATGEIPPRSTLQPPRAGISGASLHCCDCAGCVDRRASRQAIHVRPR